MKNVKNERYYVDAAGNFIGIFVGFQPPDVVAPILTREGEQVLDGRGRPILVARRSPYVRPPIPVGAIEVSACPPDGRAKWDGAAWRMPVEGQKLGD